MQNVRTVGNEQEGTTIAMIQGMMTAANIRGVVVKMESFVETGSCLMRR